MRFMIIVKATKDSEAGTKSTGLGPGRPRSFYF
jgi:hypothetical protein